MDPCSCCHGRHRLPARPVAVYHGGRWKRMRWCPACEQHARRTGYRVMALVFTGREVAVVEDAEGAAAERSA